MKHRSSSRASIRGGKKRYLQQNDKNNNKDNNKNPNVPETTAPTDSPSMQPTRQPTRQPTLSPVVTAQPTHDFQGTVHLVWSFHLTQQQDQFSVQLMEALTEWVTQDFLCNLEGILVTSSLTMESDCLAFGANATLEESETSVLWNTPTAMAVFETIKDTDLQYSKWNVSFPVLTEFYPLLEAELQYELDALLFTDNMASPLENNGIFSVVGDERAFFLDEGYDSDYSAETPTITPYPTAAPLQTDDAVYLQGIGGILAILHTISLIVLHSFGKSHIKAQIAKNKEKKEHKRIQREIERNHKFQSFQSTDGKTAASSRDKKITFYDQQANLNPSDSKDRDMGLEMMMQPGKARSWRKKE